MQTVQDPSEEPKKGDEEDEESDSSKSSRRSYIDGPTDALVKQAQALTNLQTGEPLRRSQVPAAGAAAAATTKASMADKDSTEPESSKAPETQGDIAQLIQYLRQKDTEDRQEREQAEERRRIEATELRTQAENDLNRRLQDQQDASDKIKQDAEDRATKLEEQIAAIATGQGGANLGGAPQALTEAQVRSRAKLKAEAKVAAEKDNTASQRKEGGTFNSYKVKALSAPTSFKAIWNELDPSTRHDDALLALSWRTFYKGLSDHLIELAPLWARELRAIVLDVPVSKQGHNAKDAHGNPDPWAFFRDKTMREIMGDDVYNMAIWQVQQIVNVHIHERSHPGVDWKPTLYSDRFVAATVLDQFELDGTAPNEMYLSQLSSVAIRQDIHGAATAQWRAVIDWVKHEQEWRYTAQFDMLQRELLRALEQHIANTMRAAIKNDVLGVTVTNATRLAKHDTFGKATPCTAEGTAALIFLDKRFDADGPYSAIMLIYEDMKRSATGAIGDDLAAMEAHQAKLKLFFVKADGVTFDQTAFDVAYGVAQVLTTAESDDTLFADILRLIQEKNPCAASKTTLAQYMRTRKQGNRLRPAVRHEAMMLAQQQQLAQQQHAPQYGAPHTAYHIGTPLAQAHLQASYVGGAYNTPSYGASVEQAHAAAHSIDGQDEFAAAARERRLACTNCDKQAPRDPDAHEALVCPKRCRMCGYPPNSHLGPDGPLGFDGRCIRYDGWARLTGRTAPPTPTAPANTAPAGRGGGKGKGKTGFRKIGKPTTRLVKGVRQDSAMRVYDLDVELGRIATESIRYAAADAVTEESWADIEASYEATHTMREEMALMLNASVDGAQC